VNEPDQVLLLVIQTLDQGVVDEFSPMFEKV